MRDIKNLDRANAIKEDLNNLKYFVDRVCDLPHPDISTHFKVNSIFKIKVLTKTEKTISVFGSRPFSPGAFAGSHDTEINIPYTLIPTLRKEAQEQIKELNEELKEL